jgi:hypothetical protein
MHAVTPGAWIDGPHTHKLVRVNGSEVARGSLQFCLNLQANQLVTRAKMGAQTQHLTIVEL